MALGISPSNCTTFVQIWVDVNDLTMGQITGCYAVDNLNGSGEGTTSLNSVVPTNTAVCWQVLPIDPQYAGTFSISQISAPNGWQSQPKETSAAGDVWTGRVSDASTSGSIVQGVTVNYDNGSASWSGSLPITVSIS
jgi:hypothetical protein